MPPSERQEEQEMSRKRKCRYYVNSNFVVDLMRGRREAVGLARRLKGRLCTSRVLLY